MPHGNWLLVSLRYPRPVVPQEEAVAGPGSWRAVGLAAWHPPRLCQALLPPLARPETELPAASAVLSRAGGRPAWACLPAFRASGCHLRSLRARGVGGLIGFPSDAHVASGRCPLTVLCLGTSALSMGSQGPPLSAERLGVGCEVVGLSAENTAEAPVGAPGASVGAAECGDWIVEPRPGRESRGNAGQVGTCAPAPQLMPLG